MIVSYQWLMEYLPEPVPVQELSDILTSIGLEVEAVEASESVPGGLEGLVIGEVLTCSRHPNADKLSITTVNTGGETVLNIVCGAPNVAAGQKVVVAPVGTTVHPTDGAPFLIRKAKIRGEESAGMICAEDEIGLGKSHDGIMILPADAVVGTPAKVYFNIPATDYSIHIGLTPNRSDANSHIGVARDVCAYLAHHRGGKFAVRLPEVALPALPEQGPEVTIEATGVCPRYAGISTDHVRVGESPEWLKARLQTIGVRSINNIVDITNFVLHEYGQPLHAFDADQIHGNRIFVRLAEEGQAFTGLDEKERKLTAEDLVICDTAGPLAIGGVFGGLHSGISEKTTRVFLESAYFDPKHIRRTSLRLGLRTDAATHFEKSVDISNVLPALSRAAVMITELAGGTIVSGITDVYPEKLEEKTVHVTYNYIHKLSGKAYKQLAIQEILTASGFEIIHENTEGLTLRVPSNKTDVSQPADIVEEILRIDGLDHVQIPDRLNMALTRALPNDRKQRDRIAELLCGMGLQEIVTNSIVNSKYYTGREDLVHMINSLSSELDVMRPSLMEGGLEVIEYNCNRKSQDLALFEFGNVYTRVDAKYVQEARLGIWITGALRRAQWNQKEEKAGIFYLKGIVDNLLQYCGLKNVSTDYTEKGETTEITWKWKKQIVGRAAGLAASGRAGFDIRQEVFFAEINWDNWLKAMAAAKTKYTEVPRFPAVNRDIAMILDREVTWKQVEDTTEKLRTDALQSYGLFDVFESEKLGAGKKSFALSFTFQLQDRTLTDSETEQLMKQLMDGYTTQLNAQIRE